MTYAGGAKDISDMELVERLSGGKVDLTYGRCALRLDDLCSSPLILAVNSHPSALDIFGGTGARFEDLVEWNASHPAAA